jgi:hypothetical protein
MKVVLGPLAKAGLEGNVGPDLPAAINAALVYYVGKLDGGKRPPRFPEFASMQGNREGGAGMSPNADSDRTEVEVEVDDQVAATLAGEAERQGVGVADLAAHAVLIYLAELDLIGDPEGGVPARGPAFVVRAGNGEDSPAH